MPVDSLGVVVQLRAPQRVALPVVLEGFGVALLIFQRLAECEVKVVAVLGGEVRTGQLLAHPRHIGGIEAIGLEVGEAHPCLPQARLELERAAIGADAFACRAGGLQHVAVAQPDLGLARILLERLHIDVDGAGILGDPGQYRGVQASIIGVARLDGQEPFDFGKRRGMLALPEQRDRVVVTRAVKARRELQAAGEQVLRVLIAAEPCGDLGEHADRRHVGRTLAQVLAQQCFGERYIVLAQCRRRSQ